MLRAPERQLLTVQSLTDESEREQEVAEALFDLANACGPSHGSHEQPDSATEPGHFDHSDTASSSHGSKEDTQAFGTGGGKRKVTSVPPPIVGIGTSLCLAAVAGLSGIAAYPIILSDLNAEASCSSSACLWLQGPASAKSAPECWVVR